MPMQRNLYPKDWSQIAWQLKEAANWTCAQCGVQRGQEVCNRHGALVPVIMTVAHLDHDPWNPDARLAVLCAPCHLRYDAADAKRKRVMMCVARGQLMLPGLLPLFCPVPVRKKRRKNDKKKRPVTTRPVGSLRPRRGYAVPHHSFNA